MTYTGERLRHMIVETTKSDQIVEIDFAGFTIGSTSFFDEGFAKLVQEGWDSRHFDERIRLTGIHRLDLKALARLRKYRGL